jgi:hypothetical protein
MAELLGESVLPPVEDETNEGADILSVGEVKVAPKVPLSGEFVVKFVDEGVPSKEVLTKEEFRHRRLESLLSEHPNWELLAAKIDEKIETVAKNPWFKDGLESGNEPSMQYPIVNQTTQEMLKFLADRGIITEEMAREGRINLAGSAYIKIANERLKNRQPDVVTQQLVKGANESSAIEIIKLKAQLFTEEAKKLPKH